MSVQQDSPAERVSTPVDGVDVLGALSPSRAGDFLTCPLLYHWIDTNARTRAYPKVHACFAWPGT